MIQLSSFIKIIKDLQYRRILLVCLLIVLFTFIFCFCSDDEFGGLIHLHEKINHLTRKINLDSSNVEERNPSQYKTLSHYEHKNIISYIFNRFYYVVVSTTMLGFGDIYPNTVKTRILTIAYVLLIFVVAFF